MIAFETEHWLNGPVSDSLAKLKKLGLAVDVGANTGEWTVKLANVFDKVIAVEPDYRASSLIPTKANVTLISGAVAESSGTATLYVRERACHNSLLEEHPIGGDGMREVKPVEEKQVVCYSLDDLCPTGADLVKIDIEGGEVAALRGCEDEKSWKRTVFVVECHDTFDAVSEQLVRLGKKVTHVRHPLHAHPGHCWAIGEP